MTLDKAIELTQEVIKSRELYHSQDFLDAIKLLVEAGNFVRWSRHAGSHHTPALLDGETLPTASP